MKIEETKVLKQNEDGTWSKADPIQYYPNIYERIINLIKRFLRKE